HVTVSGLYHWLLLTRDTKIKDLLYFYGCLLCFRGARLHKGLDIVCSDGSIVYAPFDVTLNGKVTVYNDPNKAAINSGINLSGEGLCFKLFYVQPDRTSGTVRAGQRLGVMLPMQSVYPEITSHIHVQMCDRSDPTPHF
ncbi:leukocyte cell-derived chemotaxin-2, partial [Notothenia coriiceps]|uniref:Leukocyte cell-derived chemotaxin-2 n=1 Tax=Notothenia coriiceps TaxID=8208 RepID=A0A6I9PFJ5_9TELE